MSVLIVNYELKNRANDYSSLFNAIKDNSLEWWHFMEHTWIVVTGHSPDQFAKFLYPHIMNTDHLLVAKLDRDHQGWLPEEAWNWLNSKQY